MTGLLAFMTVTVLTAAALPPQATDPLTGTWELNVAKSKFVPASTASRSQTRTYRVEGNQVIARHTGIDGRGNPTLIEFTATLDGKSAPLKGYGDWDAISMKKVDASTIEFTQYRDSRPALSGRTTVSKDGKTLTVTATGTAANRDKVETVAVFDRVERAASR